MLRNLKCKYDVVVIPYKGQTYKFRHVQHGTDSIQINPPDEHPIPVIV